VGAEAPPTKPRLQLRLSFIGNQDIHCFAALRRPTFFAGAGTVTELGDAALLRRPRRFAWSRGPTAAEDYFTAKQ
jgi:hypothetical protein